MNIFKWFKTTKKSKQDLELEFIAIKSKLEAFNKMFAGQTVPIYLAEENIELKVEYDILKHKIENYED